MAARPEVLAFGCRDQDLAVLREVFDGAGAGLRVLASPVEVARHAASQQPLAVFLGIGDRTLANLDVIPMLHAVRSTLPIIVVAARDSLDLERRARERSIFYYLVHPLDRDEVEAVLKDVLRYRSEGVRGPL